MRLFTTILRGPTGYGKGREFDLAFKMLKFIFALIKWKSLFYG